MKIVKVDAQKVVFNGDEASLERYRINELGDDEILVKTKCSLISIGTETTILLRNKRGSAGNSSQELCQPEEWGFDNYGKG